MSLLLSHKSDAEYVEMLRKSLRWSKWTALISALYLIVIIGLTALILTDFDSFFSEGVIDRRFGDAGLLMGVLTGFIVGNALSFCKDAVVNIAHHFRGHRTERLLLRYYDLDRGRNA